MIDVNSLKPISQSTYDRCKNETVEQLKKIVGVNPPTYKSVSSNEPIMGVLDYLGVLVFLAALAVSSLHIINYVKEIVESSIKDVGSQSGIVILPNLYISISQIGFIVLSESAMLLFMVRWKKSVEQLKGYRRFISIDLALAISAMIFVINANISSGLPILESILPPIFTIGFGLQLESIVVSLLKRNEWARQNYIKRLREYELVHDSPESHAKYRPILLNKIWEQTKRINPSVADKLDDEIEPKDKWQYLIKQQMMREFVNDASLAERVVSGESTEGFTNKKQELIALATQAKNGKIDRYGFTIDIDSLTITMPSGISKNYSSKKRMLSAIKRMSF